MESEGGVVRRARKSVASTTRQICDECGLLFAQHKDFLEHLAVFHDSKEPGRYYACGQCAQLFHTAEERRLHDADHDAAAIITTAETSRRIRRALRTTREPLPQALIQRHTPSHQVSAQQEQQTPTVPSLLSQPLRLEIESRGESGRPVFATISAPATPQSSWSPTSTTFSSAPPPPAKRPAKVPAVDYQACGSAPITPSEMYLNPPPPEPSPVGRKTAGSLGVWGRGGGPEGSGQWVPKPGVGSGAVGGGGSWSKCPRCQAAFASAWLMLEHAIGAHAARLVRLERKCFDEAMVEKRSEVYEGLEGCPFCALRTRAPSDCLLHIVQEHRSNTGLYESPDWAHRVVVSAEVVYFSPTQETRELKFKINVTLKVRK